MTEDKQPINYLLAVLQTDEGARIARHDHRLQLEKLSNQKVSAFCANPRCKSQTFEGRWRVANGDSFRVFCSDACIAEVEATTTSTSAIPPPSFDAFVSLLNGVAPVGAVATGMRKGGSPSVGTAGDGDGEGDETHINTARTALQQAVSLAAPIAVLPTTLPDPTDPEQSTALLSPAMVIEILKLEDKTDAVVADLNAGRITPEQAVVVLRDVVDAIPPNMVPVATLNRYNGVLMAAAKLAQVAPNQPTDPPKSWLKWSWEYIRDTAYLIGGIAKRAVCDIASFLGGLLTAVLNFGATIGKVIGSVLAAISNTAMDILAAVGDIDEGGEVEGGGGRRLLQAFCKAATRMTVFAMNVTSAIPRVMDSVLTESVQQQILEVFSQLRAASSKGFVKLMNKLAKAASALVEQLPSLPARIVALFGNLYDMLAMYVGGPIAKFGGKVWEWGSLCLSKIAEFCRAIGRRWAAFKSGVTEGFKALSGVFPRLMGILGAADARVAENVIFSASASDALDAMDREVADADHLVQLLEMYRPLPESITKRPLGKAEADACEAIDAAAASIKEVAADLVAASRMPDEDIEDRLSSQLMGAADVLKCCWGSAGLISTQVMAGFGFEAGHRRRRAGKYVFQMQQTCRLANAKYNTTAMARLLSVTSPNDRKAARMIYRYYVPMANLRSVMTAAKTLLEELDTTMPLASAISGGGGGGNGSAIATGLRLSAGSEASDLKRAADAASVKASGIDDKESQAGPTERYAYARLSQLGRGILDVFKNVDLPVGAAAAAAAATGGTVPQKLVENLKTIAGLVYTTESVIESGRGMINTDYLRRASATLKFFSDLKTVALPTGPVSFPTELGRFVKVFADALGNISGDLFVSAIPAATKLFARREHAWDATWAQYGRLGKAAVIETLGSVFRLPNMLMSTVIMGIQVFVEYLMDQRSEIGLDMPVDLSKDVSAAIRGIEARAAANSKRLDGVKGVVETAVNDKALAAAYVTAQKAYSDAEAKLAIEELKVRQQALEALNAAGTFTDLDSHPALAKLRDASTIAFGAAQAQQAAVYQTIEGRAVELPTELITETVRMMGPTFIADQFAQSNAPHATYSTEGEKRADAYRCIGAIDSATPSDDPCRVAGGELYRMVAGSCTAVDSIPDKPTSDLIVQTIRDELKPSADAEVRMHLDAALASIVNVPDLSAAGARTVIVQLLKDTLAHFVKDLAHLGFDWLTGVSIIKFVGTFAWHLGSLVLSGQHGVLSGQFAGIKSLAMTALVQTVGTHLATNFLAGFVHFALAYIFKGQRRPTQSASTKQFFCKSVLIMFFTSLVTAGLYFVTKKKRALRIQDMEAMATKLHIL